MLNPFTIEQTKLLNPSTCTCMRTGEIA